MLVEMAAFADFLVDRTRAIQQEWEAHLEALRAAGDLGRPHRCRLRRHPRHATPMSGAILAAITAAGVRKSFGDNLVLDGVELTVEQGTVFALLGPNGAGKTTMVRILATLLQPDHGEIRVAGHDVAREPDAVREAIGVTGQFSAIDELLTGRENLALMADLHHLARDGRAGGSTSCSSASSWSMPLTAWPSPTPAGCAAGWTWR